MRLFNPKIIARIFSRNPTKINEQINPLSNKYESQLINFQALGGVVTHKYPILTDWDTPAGIVDGHYFHQDLLVASYIFNNTPVRHIDIGSRIDGFVAHVATFRTIEIMDVRPLNETGHKNIIFMQGNLMDEKKINDNITDSLSCLHAIEHFGLGRYGDPLDPYGHIKGFNNILRMLKPGGTLYISFPIGKTNEVHFNAHRVFHPNDIFNWPIQPEIIKLVRFDYIDDEGKLHRNMNLPIQNLDVNYGCGIYTFKKILNG